MLPSGVHFQILVLKSKRWWQKEIKSQSLSLILALTKESSRYTVDRQECIFRWKGFSNSQRWQDRRTAGERRHDGINAADWSDTYTTITCYWYYYLSLLMMSRQPMINYVVVTSHALTTKRLGNHGGAV
jgi:hypothetical protein